MRCAGYILALVALVFFFVLVISYLVFGFGHHNWLPSWLEFCPTFVLSVKITPIVLVVLAIIGVIVLLKYFGKQDSDDEM